MQDTDNVNPIEIIARIADNYGVAVPLLLGHCRKAHLVDARALIAQELRGYGLTYVEIGRALNRDSTSIRQLLRRRVGPSPIAREVKQKAPGVAPRDETARLFNRMCKAGSRELAKAVYATGKLHGPMSEEAVAQAAEWLKQSPKFIAIGWMRD